jgi:hypothetical protein
MTEKEEETQEKRLLAKLERLTQTWIPAELRGR